MCVYLCKYVWGERVCKCMCICLCEHGGEQCSLSVCVCVNVCMCICVSVCGVSVYMCVFLFVCVNIYLSMRFVYSNICERYIYLLSFESYKTIFHCEKAFSRVIYANLI